MSRNQDILRYFVAVVAGILFFCTVGQNDVHAQQVGVKTNALMWAAATPNFGCEVVVGEHSSIDLTTFGHVNPYGLNSKILAFQPEFRYWFNGRPMVREYIGITTMFVTYDMNMKRYIYDGNALSLGVTGGYAFLLGSRWRFELCGGFSFLFFRHNHSYETDEFNVERANASGYKLFPAKLGVSFTYIIK